MDPKIKKKNMLYIVSRTGDPEKNNKCDTFGILFRYFSNLLQRLLRSLRGAGTGRHRHRHRAAPTGTDHHIPALDWSRSKQVRAGPVPVDAGMCQSVPVGAGVGRSVPVWAARCRCRGEIARNAVLKYSSSFVFVPVSVSLALR